MWGRFFLVLVLLAAGTLAGCRTPNVRDLPPEVPFGSRPIAAFDSQGRRAAEPAQSFPRVFRNRVEAFGGRGLPWESGYRPIGRMTLDIPLTLPERGRAESILAERFREYGADVAVILRDYETELEAPEPRRGEIREAGMSRPAIAVRRIVAEGFAYDPGAQEVRAQLVLRDATEAANAGRWPRVGRLLAPESLEALGVVDELRESAIIPLAIRADYEPVCISFARLGYDTLSPRQLNILFRASRTGLPQAVQDDLNADGMASTALAAQEYGARKCARVFERAQSIRRQG